MSDSTEKEPVKDKKLSPEKPGKSRSVMWKVLTITGLILALLIPLNMISGVIKERQANQQTVIDEIAQTWAGEQTLVGPMLGIPYMERVHTTDEKGRPRIERVRQVAYLLPQKFQVEGTLKPEIRYRGIYQSTVYASNLVATGQFNLNTFQKLEIPKQDLLWNETFLVVGIPSLKGITHQPELLVQGKPLKLLPSGNVTSFLQAGLYTPIKLKSENPTIPFKLNLTLKGSQSFAIAPIGEQNNIHIQSNWPSPSFMGGTLPVHRQVTAQGFNATWEIPDFARAYGPVFKETPGLAVQLPESAVGVKLLSPVDTYRQAERAVKYGVLFLVLTFATYFLFEMVGRQRLHPFQYLLVGGGISLFYLLLIALSEVIPFAGAYTLASLAIVTVTTLYSKAILGKVRRYAEFIIAGLLAILYSYLYILLQLEDLSLLFGALGLLIVLSVMMYVTRNIDWYNDSAT